MKRHVFEYKLIERLVLPATVALAIAGCGGGKSAGGAGAFDPVPDEPEPRSISGNVAGLNGAVTLRWSDRLQVLGPGVFDIFPGFEAGDSFTLSLSDDPLGQDCTIDSQTTFANREADVTGVVITCVDRNVIRIRVEDFVTGLPMPGVDVTASWDDGGPQTIATTVDDQGQSVIEVPEFDGRIVVNAEVTGFGDQSRVVTNTAIPAGRVARLLMLPNDLALSFDASAGADLNVGGDTIVSVPANAFVDSAGTPYGGVVDAELTLVDPTPDTLVMPGDYTAMDAFGGTLPMQSYGAITAEFRSDTGERLDLAAGVTADINIPLAEAEIGSAFDTAPLFSYDRDTGFWTEDGVGTLTTLGSGTEAYAGTVSHFSTWNADDTYVPIFLNGCVVTPAGDPLPNARIEATGVDYLGATHAISRSDGTFSLPVRPAATVLITAGDGLQSRTLQVSAGLADADIAECLEATAVSTTINLTWGQDPRDLDTRFWGFSNASEDEDFHVYFGNREVTVNDQTIVLDVDDTSGFGPEVVTVPAFPFPGIYRYGVHLWSGTGSIQASPSRVELNLSSNVTVFIPPDGTPTECWAVFDIEVDQSGFTTLRPIERWEAENWCQGGNFPRPIGGGVVETPLSDSAVDGAVD